MRADASGLDRAPIRERLFYPRREVGPYHGPGEALRIPVGGDVQLGGYYFAGTAGNPTILFFHGNGEIAADYADIGPLVASRGAGFLVVDYRGYGRSDGQPTVSTLLADAHAVFEHVRNWMSERNLPPRLVVMGRSLGSAPAVELAADRGVAQVSGLIVESGFARAKPLLRTLGVPAVELESLQAECLDNVSKIARYAGPTLVIHGAEDHLIPPADGKALYEASPAVQKDLLVVPRADHNSLFHYGLESYLAAVERSVATAAANPSARE